ESEKHGASRVVSFDLGDARQQTFIPFKDKPYYADSEQFMKDHAAEVETWKNAYWLCHRLLKSRAEVFYGDIFHLPEALGRFDVATLPFKWYPPREIIRSTLAWRMLDVTEANGKPVDMVIGMKFPAYLVEHPRKVLWVIHQYRAAYDMAGTDYDDLAGYADGTR